MKQLPKTAYGLLLTFDGYDADPKRCSDIGGLYQFLLELPEAIGMHRLGFPQVVAVDEPGICGLSAFTFIIESHISIHTYEERGFVTADIYSCKGFDTELVVSVLHKYFKTKTLSTSIMVRGTNFYTAPRTHPRQRKRARRRQ
jgi:S-adenosylmethionine decarboxylase